MNLIISNQAISQHNGLFSLNDLHKVSGGAKKHEPYQFMRNQETKELIAEIESEKQIAYETVIGKGKNQGTFVCRELVYRYAMWISAKFSLMVIRAFDMMTGGANINAFATKDERKPLVQAVNMLVAETGAIYSNVWKMIHQRFDVGCVDELTGEQVHQAVEYVHTLMLQAGNKVNAPFVQNIIADTAHQNRMAQDELGQMMAHFGKALDHIAELQNRLKRQEVLIDGAKRQLVA
ncbi:KilA-N domain-containing protein [Moraxella bovis]|uniref:KilA-N domain-containing protein n=1 Tax=Moraxella bovis TaxID=476 RepID=UPI002227A04E|nr:KilA-N domain-containing protein [Moraxella bovis]UYZ79169.1 KilA-N domain-containing protein [Moraxella bovis]UYZ87648.1 KilA-N domain-containing protein [Moraxella bovis]UYZ90790.1 KilA-N domain-containing protein [Moraxella bovis]UYZ93466.1 KilA-N domain-containing protein [Moraxella bovis]UYZ97007.1 KilA-N domain-containing protein [Moraxella bovis]